MYDVIVVGAGPSGSAAAKKCAEYGFKTLMLDKRILPRDKTCGGLVSKFADNIIKSEFGDIPQSVMCHPSTIIGHMIHIIGGETIKFDATEIITWRRNLDYWMVQKAQAKGSELWQNSKVISVKNEGPNFSVTVEKNGEGQTLKTRYVIGAEGAISITRSCLFPDFKMNYLQAYEEYYPQESLDMDRRYSHLFCTMIEGNPPNQSILFGTLYKDDLVTVHFTDKLGAVGSIMEQTWKFLQKDYNFDIHQTPVIREGCLVPAINNELIARTFIPAKGNAMLVGDAGGLYVIEGLTPSIESGGFAANAIKKSLDTGEPADKFYLPEIEIIINRMKETAGFAEGINKDLMGDFFQKLEKLS
jgi:flavin-dependent dehydrogenase